MSNLIDQNNKEIVKADIKVFECDLGSIRATLDKNGDPLFCAADVTKFLEYSNGRDAIARHCDEGDVVKRDTPTSRGIQAITYINESGLYSLILRSKNEKAKEFKRWVTKEVIPSIRKNGGYVMGQENMTELEVIANALVLANNVIQNKSKELEALKELRKR